MLPLIPVLLKEISFPLPHVCMEGWNFFLLLGRQKCGNKLHESSFIALDRHVSHLMSDLGSRNPARVAQPLVCSLTLKAEWPPNAEVGSIPGKAEICSCVQTEIF